MSAYPKENNVQWHCKQFSIYVFPKIFCPELWYSVEEYSSRCVIQAVNLLNFQKELYYYSSNIVKEIYISGL